MGLVTDLNPYLVRRVLTSLRAELKRREHLLNDKGKKDLIDLELSGDPDCPPSLLIVVDEFAALAGEIPEFVDGMVDVAQRHRLDPLFGEDALGREDQGRLARAGRLRKWLCLLGHVAPCPLA